MPVFFIDSEYVVCGKLGRQPISVALINEAGDALHSCTLQPPAPVTNWRSDATGISNEEELLASNPIAIDACAVALRDHIDGYSFLVGYHMAGNLQALGLRSGIDFGAALDISEWFAVPISQSTMQYFPLAHVAKTALAEENSDAEKSNVHSIRSLYLKYAQSAYEDPALEALRKKLLNSLPRDQRIVDSKLVLRVLSIPEGWTSDTVREIIPKALRPSVKSVKDVQFSPLANGAVLGRTVIVFNKPEKAAEMMLRIHSSPDEWEWVVKKEGYYYLHKKNGIKVEEMSDPGTQVFLHSIPDSWNEADVRWLIPETMQQEVSQIKLLQYRENKSRTARLGRTHIAFTNEMWTLHLLRLLQSDVENWTWSTTPTGGLLYQHTPTGTILEPVRNITWEHLMIDPSCYY